MRHSLLAIAILFLVAPLFAETWTDPVTGITWWTYSTSSNQATIKVATNVSDTLIIPSTINGHRVTRIGWDAFSRCTNLSAVTIPNSVTEIGDSAFAGCKPYIVVSGRVLVGGRHLHRCGVG